MVIVGAGIIGAACAAALAKAGLRVRVLERGRTGGGTTAAGGGMLSLATKSPGAALRLARRSLASTVAIGEQREIGLRRGGSLTLARGAADAAQLAERARLLVGEGVEARLLKGEQARAAEPCLSAAVAGALHCPGDAQVDPALLCAALLAEARAAGAVVEEGEEVIAIAASDGRVTAVRTAGGTIAAERVLIAAGAWSAALLAPFDPRWRDWLLPRAGALLRSDPEPPLARHLLLEAGYFAGKRADNESVSFTLQQTWDGRLLLGGWRAFRGFDPGDAPAAAIRARGGEFVPSLARARFAATSVGLRPWTPDGLPLVGPVGPEGLWVAAGHEGDGVAMAAVTGEIVAAGMTGGGATEDAVALRPARLAERG